MRQPKALSGAFALLKLLLHSVNAETGWHTFAPRWGKYEVGDDLIFAASLTFLKLKDQLITGAPPAPGPPALEVLPQHRIV